MPSLISESWNLAVKITNDQFGRFKGLVVILESIQIYTVLDPIKPDIFPVYNLISNSSSGMEQGGVHSAIRR
jgi:hypothetical protein